MSEPDPARPVVGTGSLERDLRIDSLCSRFEASLKAGEQPDVAEYLASAPEALRESLQVELRHVLNAYRAPHAERTEPASLADTAVTVASRIGPYKLVEKLGEGGMGEVWRVDQETPVKRVAAIKFIKAGMDSRQVLARFEQERHALAVLDHPNIARVLDGGLTPQLRPYFVMELVQGRPLTRFCDDARCGVTERLELFVAVCQAVQHAHQKGIVHRDLKPSNILVTLADDKPAVKVIDFGVAKVLRDDIRLESLSTHPGLVVGTLEYMAPEQAGTLSCDIDTRADIYSLGVILYELLTGLRPFSGDRLAKLPWEDLLRIIREEEPPRPSARLSADPAQHTLAAARKAEPKSLAALLRGDLDWIVMKCLEKDRARRYESASSLAREIERYLASEPVEARPPSAVYKVRKFVRRNRGAVLAGSLVLAALLAAVAGTTWGLFTAREAEAKAVGERNEKELARREEARQRIEADAARDAARRRLAQIEKSNEILASVFSDLNVDRIRSGPEDLQVVLGKRLKLAVDLLDGEAVADPLVVAGLQNRLGKALFNLGHAEEALKLFEKSLVTNEALLGSDHAETLTSLNNVANGYYATGDFQRGLPLMERVARLNAKALGAEDPQTLSSVNNLAGSLHALGKYDQALPLLEENLKLRKKVLGLRHPDIWQSLNNLAECYLSAGRIKEGLEMHQEALDLARTGFGTEHTLTLSSMHNLGTAYKEAGNLNLAVPLLEEAFRLRKLRVGQDHPETLSTMNNLGLAYKEVERLDLALPLLVESLERKKAVLGGNHPQTLTCMNNLATTHQDNGQLDQAFPLIQEALKLQTELLGVDHPDTLHTLSNLASHYKKIGKPKESRQLFEDILAHRRKRLGLEHPDTLQSMESLAGSYSDAGELEQALPLYVEAVRHMRAKLGDDHPHTLTMAHNHAEALRKDGQLTEARQLHEEVLRRRRVVLGTDHLHTLFSINNLAETYLALKQFDQALTLFEESAKLAKANLGPDHEKTQFSLNNLAKGYQATGKFEQAIETYDELLTGMRTKLGVKNPSTIIVMNNLAECYNAAGKSEPAFSLFQEALKSSVDNLGLEHPNSLAIFGNFLKAYEKAGLIEKEKSLLVEMLAILRKKFPPKHVITLQVLDQLAQRQLSSQDFVAAEQSLRECLPGFEEEFPEEWFTFEKHAMLGTALLGQKKYAEAEQLLIKGYTGMKARQEAIPDADFPKVASAVESLVTLYTALDKPAEIEKWRAERARQPQRAADKEQTLLLLAETLALRKTQLGVDHPETLVSMHDLADEYRRAGKLELALPLYEEARKSFPSKFGADHPDTLILIHHFAECCVGLGQFERAVVLQQEALTGSKAKLGSLHALTLSVAAGLGASYARLGRLDDEEALYLAFVKDYRGQVAKNHEMLLIARSMLANCQLRARKYTAVEQDLIECLAELETLPPTWRMYNAQSMLGGALLGQKKYVDAEPHLLKGYEGMKAHEKSISDAQRPRLVEAIERLIELYTALDMPEEVKKWQAERPR